MDLKTSYLGLKLDSPVVVSACTLSEDIGNIVRMEDAGAGAIVMFSLFEEQIRQQQEQLAMIEEQTEGLTAEADDGFFPSLDIYHVGPDEYLEKIRIAKTRTSIPIIGSLNGISNAGWIEYAKLIEQAGADALEVNMFYIQTDISVDGPSMEKKYLDTIKAIRDAVNIPIAAKLNPYFSSMGHTAVQLVEAGANGLVLFNRFYQPDIDINNLEITHSLEYSHPSEIRLPLLWLAVLNGKINASLAASTGVNGPTEVIKYLLAGADVAMVASALYKHGIGYIQDINMGLRRYLDRMGFENLEAMKGKLSQRKVSNPNAYQRLNYIKILESKGG